MLGRQGTGAAWAGVSLALLLWGASAKGRSGWEIAGAVLLGVALFWTFAPWIPFVRDRLPAARRVAYLEGAWVTGRHITQQEVHAEDDLTTLRGRRDQWLAETVNWIDTHVSVVEGERFRHPAAISPDRWNQTPTGRHARLLDEIHSQLDVLIRLRDEQRAKLR